MHTKLLMVIDIPSLSLVCVRSLMEFLRKRESGNCPTALFFASKLIKTIRL